MNTNTGHLVNLKEIDLDSLSNGQDYESIPKELKRAAEKKLNGEVEAYVSLTSGGRLSKFAAKMRKKKELKTKQI